MEEKKKRSIHDLIKEHSVEKVFDGEQIYDLGLEEVKANPNQPRKNFDDESLNELANSIKEHGVFQPIIVKQANEGYIIVSGERRYRAAKLARLETIPAVVRNYSSSKMAEISLVENLQREDLSPIEEAKAYEVIIKDLNITQNELANKIGKSRSYVTNIIGLLKLPKEVQDLLLDKKITMGHARTLSKLKDENKMIDLAKKIVDNNLNVRQTEEITSDESKRMVVKRENLGKKYRDEKNILSKYYQSKVQIKNDRVIFKVENEKELQTIIESLIKNAL
ncbi:MAG TPA: ParB/RepB/Spo0J family partition protein [Acholeplasma sp.]|nr:ParB/RepB/Spo0J family partition protein [Acholeplasma sp.]